jgi:hypothetical protein
MSPAHTGDGPHAWQPFSQTPAWLSDLVGMIELLARSVGDPGLFEGAIPRRLARMASRGADVTALEAWRPAGGDGRRLAVVRSEVSRLSSLPDVRSERASRARLALNVALLPSDPAWGTLRGLVDAWLVARGAPTWSSDGPGRGTFGARARELCIYIDESWPGASDDASIGTGVIAGLVWVGRVPSYRALARIDNHLEDNRRCLEALYDLVAIPERALPFVMPISLPPERGEKAQSNYGELVRASIRILLGWLVSPSGPPASIRIYLERQGHYQAGTRGDEFFSGFLTALRDEHPERYGRWSLESVRWVGKAHGYIAYADVLARLPNPASKSGRFLAERFPYQGLPGYLPLSVDLVPRLERVCTLSLDKSVEELLDLSSETRGTELLRLVLDELRPQVRASAALQERLWAALGARYQSKVRDLVKLRSAFAAVSSLAGSPAEGSSLHLRLLHTLALLQDANHDGAPVRVRDACKQYDALRSQALELDRELVAWADLNFQVHLCDRMDFEAAARVSRRLLEDPLFPALPAAMRGRAMSAAGQIHAMRGEHAQAEDRFLDALALFERAPLGEQERAGERDQTSVYRAINALDATDSSVPGFSGEVLLSSLRAVLGPIEQAAAELAEVGPLVRPYHHHLLLRVLGHAEGLDEARRAYLEARTRWEWGNTHPWELIALYRALLLWEAGGEDEASEAHRCFHRAVTIALDGAHGATLALIGGMIATVAWCCTEDESFASVAEGALATVEATLPEAAPMVGALRAVLAEPQGERAGNVDRALMVLSFNYR